MPLVMGVDVGTQGVRAIVCDPDGSVIASGSEQFCETVRVGDTPEGWFEQNPEEWWSAVKLCVHGVLANLLNAGFRAGEIVAIAVDSTSGTVVPVDESGQALRPAIMYNDARAQAEARECNQAGQELTQKLGYRFGSSFGLPKVLWLKRHEPQVWQRCRWVLHAADFIVGKLTGQFGVSDDSNALKTGYDLVDLEWPIFIAEDLGIDTAKLPTVVRPGECIGTIASDCASQTGLSPRTLVVAGVSDGTAGFIASGASRLGQWNSTLGTTLVIRGVSDKLIRDPEGRVYCHRHPDGRWLPGGASNVGGECLVKLFPGAEYATLDESVFGLMPSGYVCYPLVRRGERMPFVQPNAQGYFPDCQAGSQELYTACLEGVAYVERWCYEVVEELGARVGDAIFCTGGGARSKAWMTIRAAVLKKRLYKPSVTESAMGAAIVAASKTVYRSLAEATEAMVRYDYVVEPDSKLVDPYEEAYRKFRRECNERGLGT